MPVLSREQRAVGRKKSLEIRQARTVIKEKLKLRAITLEQAMRDPAVQRMRLVDLLEALPRIGVRRAQAILEDLKIPPNNSVARCGPKQRQALIDRLAA